MTPRSRLKFYGDRAFLVCAPKLWNNLSEHIKCSLNLTSFKATLILIFLSAILICSFAQYFFRIYYLLSYRFKHFIVMHLRALE